MSSLSDTETPSKLAVPQHIQLRKSTVRTSARHACPHDNPSLHGRMAPACHVACPAIRPTALCNYKLGAPPDISAATAFHLHSLIQIWDETRGHVPCHEVQARCSLPPHISHLFITCNHALNTVNGMSCCNDTLPCTAQACAGMQLQHQPANPNTQAAETRHTTARCLACFRMHAVAPGQSCRHQNQSSRHRHHTWLRRSSISGGTSSADVDLPPALATPTSIWMGESSMICAGGCETNKTKTSKELVQNLCWL